MNRRLQQFLELEQLTPARLASIMGIQPSGISHILSGRNKPSFDFIFNFLQKFPNISADWLISGKGKPYKNRENTPSSSQNSGFLQFQDTENSQENIEYEDDRVQIGDISASENEKIAESVSKMSVEKSVKRITLFYSDGSFKEFYPPK